VEDSSAEECVWELRTFALPNFEELSRCPLLLEPVRIACGGGRICLLPFDGKMCVAPLANPNDFIVLDMPVVRLVAMMDGHPFTTQLAMSDDGMWVACKCRDAAARAFNTTSGKCVWTSGTPVAPCGRVAFLKNSPVVSVLLLSKALVLVDVSTGVMESRSGPYERACVRPDDGRLCCLTAESTVVMLSPPVSVQRLCASQISLKYGAGFTQRSDHCVGCSLLSHIHQLGPVCARASVC
jgi:hypothetical protein